MKLFKEIWIVMDLETNHVRCAFCYEYSAREYASAAQDFTGQEQQVFKIKLNIR